MDRVLYYATKAEFYDDVIYNRFTDKMNKAAELYRIGHGLPEQMSWGNNAPKIKNLLEISNVPDDTIVSFEYRIPHGAQRIDCMLYGQDAYGKMNVIHIELKQWSNNTVNEIYSTGVFKVEALTGGAFRPVAHPRQQVSNYQQHLQNYLKVFQNGECNLSGMAYCYNYNSKQQPNSLYAEHYNAILHEQKLFSGNEVEELASQLNILLNGGKGLDVFHKVQNSFIIPSKNLMNAAANIFRGITEFTLLDDQAVSANIIFSEVSTTCKTKEKTVIIVKGGPGTGKTVIALNVLAQLAREGKYRNIFFTTRAKALRNNLKIKLTNVKVANNEIANAGELVRNIYEFKPYYYKESEIDVLLVDEAHRICNSSNHFTDEKRATTHLSQIMSLIYCSKVCVFFIDEHQAIKNEEIGTVDKITDAAIHYSERLTQEKDAFLIKIEKEGKSLERAIKKRDSLIGLYKQSYADSYRLEIDKIDKKIKNLEENIAKKNNIDDVKSTLKTPINIVEPIELKSQFRCNGADNYLDWLDESIFKDENSIRTYFDTKEYDFRIFESPQALYDSIIAKNTQGMTSRVAAGYCWRWSTKLQPNGDLMKDVIIGDFAMPWETNNLQAKGEFRSKYASSADTWAIEPEGINQIGCVFSVQGLEIDYIGVIIGPDLDYDPQMGKLVAVPGKNVDVKAGNNEDYETHIKNCYRVLMSRGKKGCYVYSCNKGVSEYLRKCLVVQ